MTPSESISAEPTVSWLVDKVVEKKDTSGSEAYLKYSTAGRAEIAAKNFYRPRDADVAKNDGVFPEGSCSPLDEVSLALGEGAKRSLR